jgi:tetratricopeptide (TPR) repeat protein
MSPEQHAGEKVDARTDQFSFAVAAYTALYGEPPFKGRTAHELRDAILDHRVTEPDLARYGGVPREVRRALLRGLSAAPEDRYATLSELLADLRAALATEETSTSLRSSRRGRLAFAALALALVLVALVGTQAARHAAFGDAGRAPRAAAVSVTTKTSPSTPTSGRTTVLLLDTENRATDPVLEGTVDAILDAALYPSTRLDPYAGAKLKELMTELDPRATAWTEQLTEALARRQPGDVVTVRTSVARDGADWRISMDAMSERSLTVQKEAEERVSGLPDIVAAAQRLGLALRIALGDPPAPDERPARLSTSIEAVHAWALARQLLAANEAPQAREQAKRAVARDPSFAEGHAVLARALHADNETPGAAREYEAALRDPEGLSAHDRLVVLGDSYAALDRHLQAIAAYEQSLARWPGELMVESKLVRSAIWTSDWALALELAKRAARDHPGVKTRETLVAAYLNDNQIEQAAREGEAVLTDLPHTSPTLFVDTALAEVLADRAPRARELWDELAAKDAEYADEGRADLALYEGRLDDAAQILEHWIDDALTHHDPGLARTEYLTLAELRLREGNRAAAALAAAAAATGSEGEDALGHQYEIAHALAASGLGARALAFSRTWSTSTSPDRRMYARLVDGDVANAAGKLGEAERDYEDAARLADTWIVHERLGEVRLARSDWTEALAELTACWTRRGEGVLFEMPSLHFLPEVLFGLARAKEGLGDADASLAYQALLATEPHAQGDPLATEARARLGALASKLAKTR